jgi:hypothetical protein
LLAEEHDVLVQRMETEMEAIAELVRPTSGPTGGAEDANDEDTADEQEPSILNVLNED